MKIKQLENLNPELVGWNDRIYEEHPTPYKGVAGMIEKARLRAVLDFAECQPSDTVLEVGCEGGNLLSRLPDVRRIVGADISRKALKDAQSRLENQECDAEFYQLDAQQSLPFPCGEFDVIICSEMLEHVENPRAVIENIHEIASNNTRIVLSVPIEAPKLLVKQFLRNIGLLGLIFPGIEQGQSEGHLHAFSAKKLLDLTTDLYQLQRSKNIWGIHYVVLLEKREVT
ncbi:MAG: class I SAM-dependent methyltransferase [Okeania sp. SIO1H6]|nr:class I SAM-dependent methyltransferase [Okeania sp. SIO1H6]